MTSEVVQSDSAPGEIEEIKPSEELKPAEIEEIKRPLRRKGRLSTASEAALVASQAAAESSVEVAAEIEAAAASAVSEFSSSIAETVAQPLAEIRNPMSVHPALLPPPARGYDQFASFNKANLDALIQANTVFVRGVEEISKEFFSQTKASLEHAAVATNAMLTAKTFKDVLELNAEFTKAQYEKLLANTSRLSELTVKLAAETVAPITQRAANVVETSVRPAV